MVVACSGLGVAGGALGIGSKVGGAGVARAVGLAVVGGVLGWITKVVFGTGVVTLVALVGGDRVVLVVLEGGRVN